jgi:endonuclease/exonuclease/phosphatase (EEP) superfamily protein YafD
VPRAQRRRALGLARLVFVFGLRLAAGSVATRAGIVSLTLRGPLLQPPETVKSHVKNIFVQKRARAVSRAQSLGLIETR